MQAKETQQPSQQQSVIMMQQSPVSQLQGQQMQQPVGNNNNSNNKNIWGETPSTVNPPRSKLEEIREMNHKIKLA